MKVQMVELIVLQRSWKEGEEKKAAALQGEEQENQYIQ